MPIANRRCLVHASGALALVACASFAHAAQFTSESAFAATLNPGAYVERFTSFPIAPRATPMSLAGGSGFAYQASTPAMAFLIFDIAGNNYLTNSGTPTFFWSSPITITFTGAPVTAVGGSFFLTTASGNIANGNLSIAFSNGATASLSNQSNTTFFGYTSATPITSLTISPPATNLFVSIDNLYVGAIPAPGAVALLALGGVLSTRRRR